MENAGIDQPANVFGTRDGENAGTSGQYDEKFFAAVAADVIVAAHRGVRPHGNFAQHRVSHGVAVGVVHVLEMIDVTKNDADALV